MKTQLVKTSVGRKKLELVNVGLNKRQKIIVSSVLVTVSFLISTQLFLFLNFQFRLIGGMAALVYLLSFWALWENMTKLKAFVLLVLPTMYAVSAVVGYYFILPIILPIRWLTRIPIAVFFGLSFYLLLLAENIFNVAAIRTIPLYRAATTTTFIFTIITALALFHGIHFLRLPFIVNGGLVFLICLFLLIPIFWSIELEKIDSKVILFSLILSLLMGELALSLSFWPIPYTSPLWAVAISSLLFTSLGLSFDYLRGRLTKLDVTLYSGFGVLVFLITYFFTSWTGY